MSVGNAAQSINFANKNLVLVIGENMDLGGDDAGARNGTGKTTIVKRHDGQCEIHKKQCGIHH